MSGNELTEEQKKTINTSVAKINTKREEKRNVRKKNGSQGAVIKLKVTF